MCMCLIHFLKMTELKWKLGNFIIIVAIVTLPS